MDTVDHDRANMAVNGKPNEALSVSFSSEDSESWTLLGRNADQLDKEPSGVEIIKTYSEVECLLKEDHYKRKQRHDSQRSIDSQLDESSDGISIISESDTTSCEKLLVAEDPTDDHGEVTIHFSPKINLKLSDYEPLSPPFTPDEVEVIEEKEEIEHPLQVQRTEDRSIESVQSVVAHQQPITVHYSSWILFSIFATAMAAVILGNAMRLQNRVDQINFEHEKRISELELENNILKNEMNKLRHLYTRSELDEQVQRAEYEYIKALRQTEFRAPADTDKTCDDASHLPESQEQQPVRKVPPQDSGVKRKVVWSGDEEEPMLIVDKDYVLPAFCYNQEQAVQDDLFFEYSAKYCDVRKRKIEARQKKAEFQTRHQPKKENYNKFIHPTSSEATQNSASFEPTKLVSPFNIDYKKALEAIKSEGSVIVEALGNILDLSPEPDTVRLQSKDTDSIATEKDQLKQLSEGQNGNHATQQDLIKLQDDVIPDHTHKPKEKTQNDRRDNNRKQGDELKYNEKKVHQAERKYKWNEMEIQVDKFLKRHGTKADNNGDDGKQYSQKQAQFQGKDDDDDGVDDNYKHQLGPQDMVKPVEHDQWRHDNRDPGSGERQQWLHSGEGSYLEQYKHDEWHETKGQDNVRNGKRQKDHNTYREHQKHDEWHEKRYKGREEYRQEGEQKQWQDRRYKGREEYRQKGELKQDAWDDKRYKGRDEYPQRSEQKHGERHKHNKGKGEHRQKGEHKQDEWLSDKRYKGREEYRLKGGSHGGRQGSEERKWHDRSEGSRGN